MNPLREPKVYVEGMAGRPTTKEAPPFGRKLAALRNARGWTQPELATRLGVTVKMVTYYEREAKNPTAKTVEKLAEVFAVPVNEFMDAEASATGSVAAKPGPPSKLEQLVARLGQLPKSKQKVVVQMLEGFLAQQES